MSFPLMAAVINAAPQLKERGLNGTDQHVLLALANRVNTDTKRCDPGMDRLAQDTGHDERTVREAIHRLAKYGVISYTERLGRTNAYVLLIPDTPPKNDTPPKKGGSQVCNEPLPKMGAPTPPIFVVDPSQICGEPLPKMGAEPVSNQEKNQEVEPGKANQATAVQPVGGSASSGRQLDLAGRNKKQTTIAPVTVAASPSGPTHRLAVNFLKNVGGSAALRKDWDGIATTLVRTHPLASLLAAVDWLWESPDPFWRNEFAKSNDPFKFFALKADKILDQHERVLRARANEQRKSNPKEKSNGKYHGVGSF